MWSWILEYSSQFGRFYIIDIGKETRFVFVRCLGKRDRVSERRAKSIVHVPELILCGVAGDELATVENVNVVSH